jgi:hypothetical protein
MKTGLYALFLKNSEIIFLKNKNFIDPKEIKNDYC